MSLLNVMLLCCSSHLSTEQFSSMFPNVSTCVSLLLNFPGDSQQQLCFSLTSLHLPAEISMKRNVLSWLLIAVVVEEKNRCSIWSSWRHNNIKQRTRKLKSLRTSYSGKDWSNSCVNEDHGIMILCPVCPVDSTDWKYFSGTLWMKTWLLPILNCM